MRKLTSILLATLALSGCAVSDDPTKGGFFSGIYGVESGAYEQRLAEREATLGAVRLDRQSAEEQQRHLAGERTAKQQEKSQLQTQVSNIDQDAKKLKNELANLKTSSNKAAKEKTQLSKRLDQVNAELKGLNGSQDDPAARQRAAQLEKEVKQLWEIYHALQ